MIALEHIEAEMPADVTVDEYVPISIEVPSPVSAEIIYWRARPDAQTLVELGMCGATGRLRSITVTAINASAVDVVDADPRQMVGDEKPGVPCFDIRSWHLTKEFGSRFRDEDVPTRMIVGPGACCIELGGSPTSPTFSVNFGTVRCLFNSSSILVRVEVNRLRESEQKKLRAFAA